ncbi:MAG: A24 family peptidase [Chloroflexota bacterium]
MSFIAAALIGIVLGVLVNLLADHLPHHRRPGAPLCAHCEEPFPLPFWLAAMRFTAAKGKCPNCQQRGALRPLLVELTLMAVIPLIWLQQRPDLLLTLHYSLFAFILLLLLVTDLEHRLIPHAITLPAIAIFLVLDIFTIGFYIGAVGAVTGLVLFLIFYLVGARFFGPGALGFGDVTLATLIGASLGFPAVFVALVIGILLGGIIPLLLVVARLRTMKSYVPYGPFLIAGAVIVYVWGEQIIQSYLN